MTETVELRVEGLGAGGDGIAHWRGRAIALHGCAPGDLIRARLVPDRRGRIGASVLARLADGPERATPACAHFGACGGCRLQHVVPAAYRRWKEGQVSRALVARGLGHVAVAPLVTVAPARRRATLRLRAGGGGAIGYFAPASHRLVPIDACPALAPPLAALLAPLRALAGERGGVAPSEVTLTLADTGVDAVFVLPAAPDLGTIERLTAFAHAADLARLSWRGDGGPVPVVERRAVHMRHGGVAVALPPGAFIQPSQAAEAALADLVQAAVGDAATVADLYAGCGTFALRLAARARVRAVEGDGAMAAALRAAAGGRPGRIEVEHRDLARRPLQAAELAGLDAVVMDPPRAGAETMARALAGSRVPRVAMVSCDPVSFARDARILVDGGYTLGGVVPIDQFVWTAEIELFAAFHRPV